MFRSLCRLADTPDSASPHLSHGREHPRRRLRERITQRRQEDAPGSLSRESADTGSACPVRMTSNGSVSKSLWPLQNRITARNVRLRRVSTETQILTLLSGINHFRHFIVNRSFIFYFFILKRIDCFTFKCLKPPMTWYFHWRVQ